MLTQDQREHLNRRLLEERQRRLDQLHAFDEVGADASTQDQAGSCMAIP